MKLNNKFLVRIAAAFAIGAASSLCPSANAQQPAEQTETEVRQDRLDCATVVTPEDVDFELYMASIGATTLETTPRYLQSVPVTIHILRRTDGTGGLTIAQLSAAMSHINDRYSSVGLRFFQPGATRYVDNTAMYDDTDSLAEIQAIANTDLIPDTVNVYFCNNLRTDDGPDAGNLPDPLCGMASFTSTPGFQAVLVDNSCSQNGSTFGHEMGHFFNLYHTHETAFGDECPDGSNCSDTGDLLCDTPADPDLSNAVDSSCNYTGNAMRCGQFFNPDVTNMMSYAKVRSCRNYFSPGQRSKILATLFNLRPNLLNAQPTIVWVDFQDDSGVGSYPDPFNNLGQALNATANGGRIVFKPSSAAGAYTLNRPMTLDSFRGTATIGQP